jgi:hypothetical protein
LTSIILANEHFLSFTNLSNDYSLASLVNLLYNITSFFILSSFSLSQDGDQALDGSGKGKGNRGKALEGSTYSTQVKREDCKDLLDPTKRPKWNNGHMNHHLGKLDWDEWSAKMNDTLSLYYLLVGYSTIVPLEFFTIIFHLLFFSTLVYAVCYLYTLYVRCCYVRYYTLMPNHLQFNSKLFA